MTDEKLEINEAGKIKKFPRTILFAIIVAIILIIRFVFAKDAPFEPVLKEAAMEVNKTCPQVIDKETRLDSVTVHHQNTFRYNYTLIDQQKDSMDVEMFVLSVEPLMIDNAKNNAELSLFRENKVTLEYVFRDASQQFVTRITITPERYQ